MLYSVDSFACIVFQTSSVSIADSLSSCPLTRQGPNEASQPRFVTCKQACCFISREVAKLCDGCLKLIAFVDVQPNSGVRLRASASSSREFASFCLHSNWIGIVPNAQSPPGVQLLKATPLGVRVTNLYDHRNGYDERHRSINDTTFNTFIIVQDDSNIRQIDGTLLTARSVFIDSKAYLTLLICVFSAAFTRAIPLTSPPYGYFVCPGELSSQLDLLGGNDIDAEVRSLILRPLLLGRHDVVIPKLRGL